MTQLEKQAAEWCRLDKDGETRSVIQRLVDQSDEKELEARLGTRLAFGTAGLRGQMGAGFSRLNSLTIIQTSQGLAEYLIKAEPNARNAGVVIGHDARHNSEKFAELTAAACIAKGIRVLWFEGLVHTPMVPFAVQTLQAAAGVMITASHNPAQDNGYKVYGSNGCQINSPVDQLISASIMENLEPISWYFQRSSPLLKPILDSMKPIYTSGVSAYLLMKENHHPPSFVYTAMHGVGLSYMSDMLSASFPNVSVTNPGKPSQIMELVKEQADPDPDFPTVRFPNPEEDGALDLAKATANRSHCNLIIANDPDADRFAAAEKVYQEWHQFTGDEVGVLLAYHIFSKLKHKPNEDDIMLVSAVSSTNLARIAAHEGFTVVETLTGFKWLGNEARRLAKEGKRVHFAYEEALGYMFPQIVHDKDGVVAAGMFLKACTEWGSPYQKLQSLYQRYGYFHTLNTYWRSPDVATTRAIFEMMSTKDLFVSLPEQRLVRKRDLSTGYDSGTDDHRAVLPSSSSTQMVTCWLGPMDGKEGQQCEGSKITIRASGTEPKIKLYLESWDKDQDKAGEGAKAVLRAVRHTWFNDPNLVMDEKYRNL